MKDAVVPDTLRICERCGALAYGVSCPTCEEYAELYATQVNASRSGEFWASLPRVDADRPYAGAGLIRGALIGMAIEAAVAGLVSLAIGFVCGWMG